MAGGTPQSLFPDAVRIEGSEVQFRSVCALGWGILDRLGGLRALCDSLPEGIDNALHWIDHIETEGIDNFTARDAERWPSSVSKRISHAAEQVAVRDHNTLVTFFNELAHQVSSPAALDPTSHLTAFNSKGFALANEMVCDPLWSTDLVRQRWNKRLERLVTFREGKVGNFQPVTVPQENLIELRVNTGKFVIDNSLLYYLTLEFQMMHEYISHLLPAWRSGNALEEEFLLAVMYLYYRKRGSQNGLVSLVREADARRLDDHRTIRQAIMDELAPLVGEERLSQLLLELAVMEESEMKEAEKRQLLALLKKVPQQEDSVRKSIQRWVSEDDKPTLFGRLRSAIH